MKLLKIAISLSLICLLAGNGFAAPVYPPPKRIIKPDQKQLMRLGLAYSQIKKFYVKTEEDKKLFGGAIRGMLAALDPHSMYLDEEMLKDLNSQTRGKFAGIGVEITMDKNIVKVIAPIDDTPAAKAGIKAGDYIIAIDDKPLIDMSVYKIVKLIRGKPGTTITLTVINKEDKKPRALKITREIIHVNSVKSKMLEKGYGYIRITNFQKDTGKKLITTVKKLQKESKGKLKGLILDLRNNPGGLLDSSVEAVDAFIDSALLKGDTTIVYTKGRVKQAEMRIKATRGDLLNGAPIVVLINQGSASGSEIVAGALQDYKRALIVGKTSFGKGSVQTLLPLDNKTGIKLTTALYYTPKGRSIQAKGIEPDILIENLKISKPKEEAIFFSTIREKHLSRHLRNGNKTTKDKLTKAKQMKAATEDYQLYQALTILKTMSLTRSKSPEDA